MVIVGNLLPLEDVTSCEGRSNLAYDVWFRAFQGCVRLQM